MGVILTRGLGPFGLFGGRSLVSWGRARRTVRCEEVRVGE